MGFLNPMAADERRFDLSSLNRKKLTVSLGGLEFIWEEPVRRAARGMFRQIMLIFLSNGIQFDTEKMKVLIPREKMLYVVDAALDFCYANHPDMKEQQPLLDDCDEESIGTAFMEVVTFICAPFSKDATTTAEDWTVETTGSAGTAPKTPETPTP